MLIMWRRKGESLIAGEVEIEILDARQDRVKLGIRAPESCTIERREKRIVSQQNITSALSASTDSVRNLLDTLIK